MAPARLMGAECGRTRAERHELRKAIDGDRVQVHYRGEQSSGEVFADSTSEGPLEFIIGDDTFFADFGAAVVGMEAGESKSLELAPERAFGPHREELVRRVERTFFRTDQELSLGSRVVFKSDGKETEYRVIDVDNQRVTMDANHPLAGKTLSFDIRLTKIF
jgi:peptidylprolyl isomerase